MHQEITSPSPSSRIFFHMPKTFHRRPGMHCFLAKCRKVRFQCSDSVGGVVFVRTRQQSHQCARWRLAPCSFSLSSAPHDRLDGRKRRWRRVSPTPASSAVAEPPVAASRGQPCLSAPSSTAQTTRGLRVAIPSSAHAATPSPWPGKHRARSLPPTCP